MSAVPNMDSGDWQPGDVAGLIVNPFYAIEIHPSFSERHSLAMSETMWLASNASAIDEMGATRWLGHLLAALKAEHGGPDGEPAVADPYVAIMIHPMLCVKHEPLVDEATWVQANEREIGEGVDEWLRNLLSVLKGAFVASDDAT